VDYYAVLGISRDADQAAVRRAFRRLARRYHPDAGEGSSPAQFRAAVEAYETLRDPERRRAYDRSLRPPRMRVPVEPMTAPPLWGYAGRRDLFSELAELERTFDELFRSFESGFPHYRR
jgi:curved DNA-binding protein CbpA